VPPAADSIGPPRYEILHDVIGATVLARRRQHMAQRQQEIAGRQLVAQRERAEAAARRQAAAQVHLISVVLVVLLLMAATLVRSYEAQSKLGAAAAANSSGLTILGY
jgi:hypothetical protein